MQHNGIDLEPFTTREPQRNLTTIPARERTAAWVRRKKRVETRVGSMVAKITICMAILALVILAEAFLLRGGQGNVVETAVTDQQDTGETDEEVLGRLRFVEAGGVKSVFAVSQRWDMPVSYSEASNIEDETTLFLRANAGENVRLSAAGEVKSVGTDEILGDYVRISHGGELESVYYHLSNICVEEGQPLSAKDVLGKVAADGTLYVCILQNGSPVNPETYLNVQADG